MEQYDSDDSLSDVDSSVSTNVLLGYASKEPTDDSFSQLGGQPAWLDPAQHPPPRLVKCKICSDYMSLLLQLNGDLPARFPGHERKLYIWACRRKTCRRKDGSIRAFRSIRLSKQALSKNTSQTTGPSSSSSSNMTSGAPTKKEDVGSALFGAKPSSNTSTNPFSASSNANPFSTAPGPLSSLAAKPPQPPSSTATSNSTGESLPETFAQKARISSPASQSSPDTPTPEPWPEASEFPRPYPEYYLDADYEYLSPTAAAGSDNAASANGKYAAFMDLNPDGDDDDAGAEQSSSTSRKASKQPPPSKQTSTTDADDETPHDKTFLHFADTLAQNPEQVLRYEFGGTPLLYSRLDSVGRDLSGGGSGVSSSKVSVSVLENGMPRCTQCWAARVFELQLTPHAITELEADEEAALFLGGEGMEWGTVILGVCSADCGGVEAGEVKYVEEWVGVQWEEVVEARAGEKKR